MEKLSVITPVNNRRQYQSHVVGTLKANQFLPIYNGKSAARALNEGIDQANNDLCVFCHQDVRFPPDWIERLDILESLDFGVVGVFGLDMDGKFVGSVIDGGGIFFGGKLPAKAQSVDELLFMFRKSSGLRFDESLGGWHLYGADICLQAMDRGLDNYIIDACVGHLSPGSISTEFLVCRKDIERKWRGNTKIRNFKTTCTEILL